MYKLTSSTIPNFDYIVHSTDEQDIIFLYDDLRVELSNLNVVGKVLIDRFTSTNSAKRFISLYFDGNNILQNTIQNVEFVKASYERNILNQFYKDNYNTINLSVVAKPIITLLKRNDLQLF